MVNFFPVHRNRRKHTSGLNRKLMKEKERSRKKGLCGFLPHPVPQVFHISAGKYWLHSLMLWCWMLSSQTLGLGVSKGAPWCLLQRVKLRVMSPFYPLHFVLAENDINSVTALSGSAEHWLPSNSQSMLLLSAGCSPYQDLGPWKPHLCQA